MSTRGLEEHTRPRRRQIPPLLLPGAHFPPGRRSDAPKSASLTRLILKDNSLGPAGAQHLSEALKVNKSVTELDISNGGGSSSGDIKSEGAKYIADMLSVNGELTSVRSPAHEPVPKVHTFPIPSL